MKFYHVTDQIQLNVGNGKALSKLKIELTTILMAVTNHKQSTLRKPITFIRSFKQMFFFLSLFLAKRKKNSRQLVFFLTRTYTKRE